MEDREKHYSYSSSSDESDYAPRVPIDPPGNAQVMGMPIIQVVPHVDLAVVPTFRSPTTTALPMFPMPQDISVSDLLADWCYDDTICAIVQERYYISWRLRRSPLLTEPDYAIFISIPTGIRDATVWYEDNCIPTYLQEFRMGIWRDRRQRLVI